MVNNGCDQSGWKLTVSEEWTDGLNWLLACWYKFTKMKNWSKIFDMGMVKDACGQSDRGALKLTVS